jgi:hypothetical protein
VSDTPNLFCVSSNGWPASFLLLWPQVKHVDDEDQASGAALAEAYLAKAAREEAKAAKAAGSGLVGAGRPGGGRVGGGLSNDSALRAHRALAEVP